MGNIRSEDHTDFLYDSYNVVGEQHKLKILEEKTTGRNFALREDCFVHKLEYDRAFKRLTQRNNNNDCENVLQLIKIWSKEHTGICSNLYKIYTVYEYPRVKLIDEIVARRKENKLFEEVELFSILQSCLNAISHDSTYINISPHIIFIQPEGVLKLQHIDLIDPNYRTMFNDEYYYSPEKMAHFQNSDQFLNQLQKQTVFSLGMTILHSVLLESPSFCYEISMKRFNYRKLQILLSEAMANYSPALGQLLEGMTSLNPQDRPSFDYLQAAVNDFFNKNDSLINSTAGIDNARVDQSIKLATQQVASKIRDVSLVYSGDTFYRPSTSDLGAQSNNKKPKSELQLVFQQSTARQQAPKSHHMLERTKKLKQSNCDPNKQNIYTDPKLIEIIKDGIQKINRSTHDRPTLHSSQQQTSYYPPPPSNSSTQPQLEAVSSKDRFSDYEFHSEPKDKCTFVVQTYEDQSHFEGMLQNKMKNGYGKLTYPDGVYYEGNFKNDTLHGKGSLFYGTNRPAYVGDWVNNQFHGNGTLYNEYPTPLLHSYDYRDFNKLGDSWIKYEGQFVQDIKSGQGRIILTNGEMMEGAFEKGLLNGHGTFTNLYGGRIEGCWKKNAMILY